MRQENENRKTEALHAARVRRAAVLVSALWFLVFPAIAEACTVCYGEPGTPMTDGARNGVFFLLGVIGAVQIGFVAMFVSFWRKAKEVQKRKESWRVVERFPTNGTQSTSDE